MVRERRPEVASSHSGRRAGGGRSSDWSFSSLTRGKPLGAPDSGFALPAAHAAGTWGAKGREKKEYCLGHCSVQLLRKADYPPPRLLVWFLLSDSPLFLPDPSDIRSGRCLGQPHPSFCFVFWFSTHLRSVTPLSTSLHPTHPLLPSGLRPRDSLPAL